MSQEKKFCFVLFLETFFGGGRGGELLVMKSTHAHSRKHRTDLKVYQKEEKRSEISLP